MSEFILITTERSTTPPNEEIEVENCQVLGIVNAPDKSSSIDILFQENPWISDAGFTREKIISKPLLTEENINDIRAIIDYIRYDKQNHHDAQGNPISNIFKVLENLEHLVQCPI